MLAGRWASGSTPLEADWRVRERTCGKEEGWATSSAGPCGAKHNLGKRWEDDGERAVGTVMWPSPASPRPGRVGARRPSARRAATVAVADTAAAGP